MDFFARKDALRDKDGGMKGSFGGNLVAANRNTILSRLKLCRSCENYKIGICKKCGCFVKAKIRLNAVVCPVQKW